MNDTRTTPFGMWRYGNDFRKAALAVLTQHNDPAFVPYYFLLGQSIELSLKAFLMGRGVPLKVLRSRKYGHDLKALLDEARRRKLGFEVNLAPAHCGVIHLLGIEYLGRRFQYIRTGTMILPHSGLSQEAADLLSAGLKEYSHRVTKW